MSRISSRLGRTHARLVSTATPQPIAAPSQCPSTGNVTSSAGYPPPHSTACTPPPRQVTIGELSDKVLLKIFCHFLDASPRHWPTLMHICRKWRRIVFGSQRALRLQLFCTHGMAVLKTIDCFPALPIVVQYGGSQALDPPAPEDEDDIIAALTHSDRITSINLTVTSSLLKKLSAIKKSFEKLEHLILLSRDGMRLTLPNSFQWGPHLRHLHSTGIAFPALLQLLHLSRNLVDLHLHEVLDPSHTPPEALINALTNLIQLRSLSLHFLPTVRHLSSPPPSGELVVLPALSRLNFQGSTEYLEGLVARIDTPLLGNIEVTIFNKSNFGFSTLRKFIDRIGMHKSYRRAEILSSGNAISIFLTRPGDLTCLKFQSFREPLSEQLSIVAQICIQLSVFLCNVEELHISAQRPSNEEHGLYSERWQEIINSFTGVKWFHVSGNLSANIVRPLRLVPGKPREFVLPALQNLYILQPGPCYSCLREAVVSFMVSRRLSCRPILVDYEYLCHINEVRGTLGGTGMYSKCRRHSASLLTH